MPRRENGQVAVTVVRVGVMAAMSAAGCVAMGAGSVDRDSAIGAQTASHSAEVPVKATRAVHIRLSGDLDCVKLERDLRAALDKAKEDRAGTVLLELSGNRWRADVATGLAKTLAEVRAAEFGGEGLTLVAYLHDGADRRVGGGHAAIALCCHVVVQSPDTRVVAAFGDELTGLTPPGTDAAESLAGFRKEVENSCRAMGRSTKWAEVFPRATRSLWWVGGDPWASAVAALSETNPGPEPMFGAGVIAGPAGVDERSLVVVLSAEEAKRSGLVGSMANSPSMALASVGARTSGVRRIEVESNLAAARVRLHEQSQSIDRALRQADADLREASRSRSSETLSRRRAAGARTKEDLKEVQRQILDAESILNEYPELLCDVPPGQTTVGQTPERLVAVWRGMFQDWRDDLASSRARAETLSSVNAQ